jgi:hypothetical protein
MRLFHFSILPPTGNFGDDALTLATKAAVEDAVAPEPVEWVDYPVRNHTSDAVIRRANECDAVLVGGGGLMLCDTAPNSYSGWQWACSVPHLRRINVPIVVLAVGYNRFRGQPEFKPVFTEHIRRLVDKAAFFSVRNSGSRRALEHYGVDVEKVHVVPCPSILYASSGACVARTEGPTRIGVNLAGDRLDNRLSGCATDFPAALRAMVLEWTMRGWEVHFIHHNWKPESNCRPYVDACLAGPVHNHDVDANWGWEDVDRVHALYSSMDAVVAMRGHAQMIPFGLGVPVCSLVSHQKLAWFLEDAGMEDTGVDVRETLFWRRTIEVVDHLLEEPCTRQTEALEKLRVKFLTGMTAVRAALS